MSFLGKAIKRMRGSYALRHQSLEKFGVFAYNDEAVTNRVVTLGDLMEKFWDQSIDDRVRTLDAIIDTIAGPWGEGGDTERYYRAYGSWKLLLGRFHSMNRQLDSTSNGEGQEGNGEEEFRKMAQVSAEKHLIPYGWMIVEAAWKGKHINAATPIVIQSTSPFMARSEIPVGYGPKAKEPSE